LQVLLVEDSQVLAERLSEAITEIEGVSLVGTTDNETSAVSAVTKGHVDVVVLDLHLRSGTGFGVMRGIASSEFRPTVIVLTNYDLPEYKKSALALGASYFLDKARDYWRLTDLLIQIEADRPRAA
jgi:two-component system OmpR family response regulator